MMVDDGTKATASSNPFDECEDIFGLLKAGSEPRETQFLSWARTAPNASAIVVLTHCMPRTRCSAGFPFTKPVKHACRPSVICAGESGWVVSL